MASRSRSECEEIIKRGESVLLPDGRNISKIEDLPSAVELAGDDIVLRQAAIKEMETQAQKLQDDIAAAKAATASDPAPEGSDATAPGPDASGDAAGTPNGPAVQQLGISAAPADGAPAGGGESAVEAAQRLAEAEAAAFADELKQVIGGPQANLVLAAGYDSADKLRANIDKLGSIQGLKAESEKKLAATYGSPA